MPLQAPANYLLNLPDPAEQVQKDMQFYLNAQQAQVQNNLIRTQVQEHQLKAQQQQAALAQQERQRAHLEELNRNPTVDNLEAAIRLFPDLSEKFQPLIARMDKKQQEAKLGEVSQVAAALYNQDLPALTRLVNSLAPSYEAGGRGIEATALKDAKAKAERGEWAPSLTPVAAMAMALAGPEKGPEIMERLRLMPKVVREKEATTRVAEQNARDQRRLNATEIAQRAGAAVSSRASAAATKGKEARDAALAPSALRAAELGVSEKEIDLDIKRKTGLRQAEATVGVTEEARKAAERGNLIGNRFGLRDAQSASDMLAIDAEYKRGDKAVARASAEADAAAKQRENRLGEQFSAKERQAALDKAASDLQSAGVEREKAKEQILNFKAEREQTAVKTKQLAQEIVEAPADLRKIFHEMNQAGAEAVNEAQQAEVLHRQLTTAMQRGEIGSGTVGRIAAWFRQVRGAENAADGIQRQIAKFRSREAVALLPPGAASDADIAFVLQGFTLDRGNPTRLAEDLSRFIRAKKKVALMSQAYVEWGSSNRGVGAAGPGLKVAGKRVLKGETWPQFLSRAFPVEGAK